MPQHVDQPWPSGRTFHTTTCLVDPECMDTLGSHLTQHLLVLWGKGDDNKHCNDVWILNVDTMRWKEVRYITMHINFRSEELLHTHTILFCAHYFS